jgi:CheY-like chemotaxis protein
MGDPADALRTVLLVEDDPNDRLIAEHAFDRSSPRVRLRTATDGEDAVAYLRGENPYADRAVYPLPDVILLDLKLPRKSGLEVLAWIREHGPVRDVPVFILSSSQERADIDLAYALGANSFLVKQVDIRAIRVVARGVAVYAGLASGTGR